MYKYKLSFVNKSLENEYFYKVAFPHYNQIFSAWCKILILISIPCSLFTYFTNNLQYLGFIWCIITSSIAMLIIRYKKSAFNFVVAIYNVSFVVLNVCFIYITDKNIGAEGQSNNMMFIFAGSQYIFHFILSIGSNFLLNSVVIFVQNFSYSAVFFPGTLNSFHGLLLFSMCFLIWMKYTNEKYQREVFLLQENEKEWSSFVRDVLPSSVIMVKYDTNQDQIQNKLINKSAQIDYNLKDDQCLTQFLRNTIIQKDPKQMQQGITSATGASILKNQAYPTNTRGSIQNGYFDTLERFIYYRFKNMVTKPVVTNKELETQKKDGNQINTVINDLENSQSKSPNIISKNKYSLKDSTNLMCLDINTNSTRNLKLNQNYETSSSHAINKDIVQTKKNNTSFLNRIEEQKVEKSQQVEQYKVEEFKAQIIKNNVKVEVLIKMVFYNLSYPVCSISIDEGLKQQVINISRQSRLKESIYFQHFQKIAQKFQKVILIQDIKLLQPYNLLHLNHLRNIQDMIQLKQEQKLKIQYSPFQLKALLQYINAIYSPVLKSQDITFSIQVCDQYPIEMNLSPVRKGNLIFSDCEMSNDKNQLAQANTHQDKLSLIEKILPFPQKKSFQDLDKVKDNNYCTQYQKYDDLDNYAQSVKIFNDQQRICQVIINLIENSSEYLNAQSISSKQIQLLIKVIHGLEEHSNLIEFKVINNANINYSQQNIYLIKDSLRVEREMSNSNFIWQSQTQIRPTQLGLKLNQKILEKTSPFNYMDIVCNHNTIDFSFFVYQDCVILMQDNNKNFVNKRFDQIRDNHIEQSYNPNIIFNNNESNNIKENIHQSDKYSIGVENNDQKDSFNTCQQEKQNKDESEVFQCFSQQECLDEKINSNIMAIHEFESKHIQQLKMSNISSQQLH